MIKTNNIKALLNITYIYHPNIIKIIKNQLIKIKLDIINIYIYIYLLKVGSVWFCSNHDFFIKSINRAVFTVLIFLNPKPNQLLIKPNHPYDSVWSGSNYRFEQIFVQSYFSQLWSLVPFSNVLVGKKQVFNDQSFCRQQSIAFLKIIYLATNLLVANSELFFFIYTLPTFFFVYNNQAFGE